MTIFKEQDRRPAITKTLLAVSTGCVFAFGAAVAYAGDRQQPLEGRIEILHKTAVSDAPPVIRVDSSQRLRQPSDRSDSPIIDITAHTPDRSARLKELDNSLMTLRSPAPADEMRDNTSDKFESEVEAGAFTSRREVDLIFLAGHPSLATRF